MQPLNLPDLSLASVINSQPYPLLFATISGSHLYGFPSPDSDYDLRGVHLLTVNEVVGLKPSEYETIESNQVVTGLEIDLVTHDAKKFFELLLRRNGYVLEQLYSPLIVRATSAHDTLKRIAQGCITRHHYHHYGGFAANQWRLFEKERPRRVKPLLYTYRALLTGIHLMQTGELEANLLRLNETFKLPYLSDLVARKRDGTEQETLDDADMALHESEYTRLQAALTTAFDASTLPEAPTAYDALNALLIDLRINPFAIG